MKILYGVEGKYNDVTFKAFKMLYSFGFLRIPKSDVERARILGDHLPGTLKHIKIENVIYTNEKDILIKCDNVDLELNRDLLEIYSSVDKLNEIHKYICIDFGNVYEEYPEQLLSVKYIKKTDTILEIGGNIGRNSCLLATLLDNSERLVVLESCKEYADQLEYNRRLNNLDFHIESKALSVFPLIQKEWNTYASEIIPEGYTKVDTFSVKELNQKYSHLKFNVLVADCEGALYQILKDEPYLLENIDRVIIENDFHDLDKKKFVDSVFATYNLLPVYSEAGGWGPCYNCFYQVFSR